MNFFVAISAAFIIALCSFTPLHAIQAASTTATEPCEEVMNASLAALLPLIENNDFSAVESILTTIESACGQSEFTQRLRVLGALIGQQHDEQALRKYLYAEYDEELIMRWDYAIEKDYLKIYNQNKGSFNYVPLNHALDKLVKTKAAALLSSLKFSLTPLEERICWLFSDNIERYLAYKENGPNLLLENEAAQASTDSSRDSAWFLPAISPLPQQRQQHNHATEGRLLLAIGINSPLQKKDAHFRTNATLAAMYSSPLHRNWNYELGLKVRINKNDDVLNYHIHGETHYVNSSASLFVGGKLGYKVWSNANYILSPQVGLAWESTFTGLYEEVEAYYDYQYNAYSSAERKYNNINTLQATLGFTLLRQIKNGRYVGLSASYQKSPYHWDKHLQTTMASNYMNLDLIFRF